MKFLLIFFLAIGCTAQPPRKTSYTVAQGSFWEFVNFYGIDKTVLGFSNDLLLQINVLEGVQIRTITTSDHPLTNALERKDIDAIITALPIDAVSQRLYRFSDPYFEFGLVLLTRRNSSYQTLDDLKNREIGVERSSGFAAAAQNENYYFLRTYDDTFRAVEDLVKGKIDGVVLNSILANRLISGLYKDSIHIVGAPILPVGLHLVVKKGENEELIELFNHSLSTLKESGVYQKLLDYWGLTEIASY
jgi:polar amino acid transport system substrate-binding protein